MEPPSHYHPLNVVLTHLALAAIFVAVALRVDVPPEFFRPFSVQAVAAGFIMGLLWVLAEALQDRAGGDEYLRRQVAGRARYWSGRYSWVRALCFLLVFGGIGSGLGYSWVLAGVCLGIAAPYPYWRGHWQRLQRVAQEETQAASVAIGGPA